VAQVEFFEHPEYSENQDNWETYHDLYEGDPEDLKSAKYLWPHELETIQSADSQRIRAIREMRSTYTNLLEPIVSRYTSLFFKDPPVISPEVAKMFGDEINDVTGTGKSLVSFIQDDVTKAMLLYGKPIVLTDAPSIEVSSLAEQKALGLRPIFRLLPALDVKDWEVDGKNGFKFLRYEYCEVEPRESASKEPTESIYSKVFSFSNGVYTVETYKAESEEGEDGQKWKLVDSYTKSGFPNLPIRSIENGESWVKDVAEQCRKLYNLESTRDSIQYFQAHQRIFFKGVVSEEQKKAIAEYTAGFLPADAGIEVLQPVDTTSIDNNIEKTVQNIFRIAFNQNRVSADSAQVESAATQRETKEQVAALIESEIESIENLANQFIKDYAFFKGIKNFEGKIQLSRNIQDIDIDKEILILNALRDDIRAVPSWYREVLKKLAAFQGLDNFDAIAADIDKTSIATNKATVDTRSAILTRLANGQAA